MREIPMSKRGNLRAFAPRGALGLFSLLINSGVQGGTLKFKFDPALSDSRGNIYTGEVWNGERVQRFVPTS